MPTRREAMRRAASRTGAAWLATAVAHGRAPAALAALATLAHGIAAPRALAQSFPARPVRLLVGFAAGGGADAIARAVAAKLAEALGVPVNVDNRPGATGMIAASELAKASPDGHTLYFADTSVLIASLTSPNPPVRPLEAFAPVGEAADIPLVVVANLAFPADTPSAFVDVVRAAPGRYAYATSGIGTIHHLAMEWLSRRAGLRMTHVPYKGASQILPDLIGGQVPIAVVSAAPALAQARAGKLKVIGLTSPVKLADAPDWPSFAEIHSGFDASPRLFVVAPAGTPAPVIARLDDALRRALASADLAATFGKQGARVRSGGPAELAADMQAESARWGSLVREAGIKLE